MRQPGRELKSAAQVAGKSELVPSSGGDASITFSPAKLQAALGEALMNLEVLKQQHVSGRRPDLDVSPQLYQGRQTVDLTLPSLSREMLLCSEPITDKMPKWLAPPQLLHVSSSTHKQPTSRSLLGYKQLLGLLS